MVMTMEVDSGPYVSAVGEIAGASRSVVSAISVLTDTLYASGAMAGSDTAGTHWAGEYDPAAARLVQAGCDMTRALASTANLLNGSLANHLAADHAARIYPGEPDSATGDTDPGDATESIDAPAPPSAAGGTGDVPGWWHWIAAHVEGLLWPDADTGKLRSAGAAWKAAGSAISGQQASLTAADAVMEAITSPESDDVHTALQALAGHLRDLGAMYTKIGQACQDYAGHVDDTRASLIEQLDSFLEWTIAIEAAGGVLAIFTAGISEAAAQAAEAGEVASAAGKVIMWLNKLIELARTVTTAIRSAIETLAELAAKLGKFINADMVKAFEEAGDDLAEEVSEDLSEDLKPGDPLPEDARPPSAGADWDGRVANNGKGEVWQKPGAPKNADSVRIMEPTSQYPDGYVRFYNDQGQPIGLDGKPNVPGGSKAANAQHTHIPMNSDGTYPTPKGWNP